MMWQLNGGRSQHVAAATAIVCSQTYIKPMKINFFAPHIKLLLINPM